MKGGENMAKVFEIGHLYTPAECSRWSPIEIIGRTSKMVKVRLADHPECSWRMLIHHDADGNEYVTDSRAGRNWRDDFTYRSQWECDRGTWNPI